MFCLYVYCGTDLGTEDIESVKTNLEISFEFQTKVF